MSTVVEFWVPGTPAPQGSKDYKGIHGGKAILVESSQEVGPWRERVAMFARQAMRDTGVSIMTGVPVAVYLAFHMPRPKSAPQRFVPAIKRPDIDKLVRSCADAITGVVISDDSQITELRATKILTLAHDTRGPGVYARITGQEVPE